MVYQTLKIVLGFVVSKQQLSELLDIPKEEMLMNNDQFSSSLHDAFNVDSNVKVYGYPCCSPLSDKKWIIGIEMHKYYRKLTNCKDCGEYSTCDTCIGFTNNGYYNIIQIFEKITKVNLRNICFSCFHDNKEDMELPIKTTEIVNGRFVPTELSNKQCNCCGFTNSSFRNPRDHLEFSYDHLFRKLNVINSNVEKNRPIKLYYVINDCLSCT